MERGNVRADVNVSLRPTHGSPLGTRTETKNVNSFRSVERAVRYEVSRQAGVLDGGVAIIQETRHWHEDTGTTASGRVKSDAEDYRYFPEPDLVPIAPDRAWVEEIRARLPEMAGVPIAPHGGRVEELGAALPEMPAARRRRLQAEWEYADAEMRDVVNAGAVERIETTIAAGASPAAARKWWMGELARTAKQQEVELADLPVTPTQ